MDQYRRRMGKLVHNVTFAVDEDTKKLLDRVHRKFNLAEILRDLVEGIKPKLETLCEEDLAG